MGGVVCQISGSCRCVFISSERGAYWLCGSNEMVSGIGWLETDMCEGDVVMVAWSQGKGPVKHCTTCAGPQRLQHKPRAWAGRVTDDVVFKEAESIFNSKEREHPRVMRTHAFRMWLLVSCSP